MDDTVFSNQDDGWLHDADGRLVRREIVRPNGSDCRMWRTREIDGDVAHAEQLWRRLLERSYRIWTERVVTHVRIAKSLGVKTLYYPNRKDDHDRKRYWATYQIDPLIMGRRRSPPGDPTLSLSSESVDIQELPDAVRAGAFDLVYAEHRALTDALHFGWIYHYNVACRTSVARTIMQHLVERRLPPGEQTGVIHRVRINGREYGFKREESRWGYEPLRMVDMTDVLDLGGQAG